MPNITTNHAITYANEIKASLLQDNSNLRKSQKIIINFTSLD